MRSRSTIARTRHGPVLLRVEGAGYVRAAPRLTPRRLAEVLAAVNVAALCAIALL